MLWEPSEVAYNQVRETFVNGYERIHLDRQVVRYTLHIILKYMFPCHILASSLVTKSLTKHSK